MRVALANGSVIVAPDFMLSAVNSERFLPKVGRRIFNFIERSSFQSGNLSSLEFSVRFESPRLVSAGYSG